MNHDDPRHRSPPRAEPLQPDQPTKGGDRQEKGSGDAPAKGEQAQSPKGVEKLKKQSEDALSNVREGYGGH